MSPKTLVVYFSHKGMNYSNGNIINLIKGNTEIAAEMISAHIGADLFEIVPQQDYPFEYRPCTEAAKAELQSDARPALAEDIDITEYNVIIVGFPNWWSTMPMPVWTFLENHDFVGKVIMPFCTHEGSGMGNSEKDLHKLAPDSDIRKGLAIHGSSVNQSQDEIIKWLKQNGV